MADKKEEDLNKLIIDITTENGFKYNERNLQLVRAKQRSNDWISIRKKCITATDATFINTTFIERKRYYKKSKIDFFDYKHGINQKDFSYWEIEKMKRGELTEFACEKIVEEICLNLDNVSMGKKNYTYLSGISYIRDGWAMASTDYVIFEDEKLYGCVEIKNTESNDVFQEYKNGTHKSFAQLCWQMKVTGCKKGILICCFKGNVNNSNITKLDTDSSKYKSISDNYNKFKEIHKSVCIDKKNPCDDIVNKLTELTDELMETKARFELFKEKRIEKQKKLDSLNKTVKVETEILKEFQKTENELLNKFENVKKILTDKCVKEGIYSSFSSTGERLVRKTVKGIVCMSKYPTKTVSSVNEDN